MPAKPPTVAPEKEFFRLDEIGARWSVDRDALLDYARRDLLVFAVYLRDIGSHSTTTETDEGTVTRTVRTIDIVRPVTPPSPIKYLRADDARRLLEAGPGVRVIVGGVYASRDRTRESGTGYLSGKELSADDMVITREERDRFEAEHGLERGGGSVRGSLERLLTICRRFPIVARTFRKRYGGRAKFEVKDEYDVQDLMQALLAVDFEDVRREDAVPSRAGGNSRIDFLLNEEELGLELKMASPKLRAKELGVQLVTDIERYRAHPKCKTLVCLVYDPDHEIENPRGIERDLSGVRDGLEVHVLIVG
jgi:hypothetical protein